MPIRVHASTPLGLYAFSGFRIDPVWWSCSLALVLLHELGHAWVVRRVGAHPTEVMLSGFGGHCAWRGEVSPLGRAAIACGGVAAQLLLLGIALTLNGLGLVPPGPIAGTVLAAATWSNAWLVGLNLLPICPSTGPKPGRSRTDSGSSRAGGSPTIATWCAQTGTPWPQEARA